MLQRTPAGLRRPCRVTDGMRLPRVRVRSETRARPRRGHVSRDERGALLARSPQRAARVSHECECGCAGRASRPPGRKLASPRCVSDWTAQAVAYAHAGTHPPSRGKGTGHRCAAHCTHPPLEGEGRREAGGGESAAIAGWGDIGEFSYHPTPPAFARFAHSGVDPPLPGEGGSMLHRFSSCRSLIQPPHPPSRCRHPRANA